MFGQCATVCGKARVAAPTLRVVRGNARVTMKKQGIHPEFFPEAKVFCNGEEVMTVGGTKKEYVVDLWSGNHPYFQGATQTIVVDEGQVNRFKRRFASLGSLSTVQTMANTKGDAKPAAAAAPAAPASKGGKGKKK